MKTAHHFQYFLVLLTNLNGYASVFAKRGPHHPRSELSHTKPNIDQHLTHEEHKIDDDLQQWGINVDVDKMTDEEKHFYYFKVHDSDNNNALDGLEMLQAALHQGEKFSKVDRDSYLENITDELNHIIDVIDDFMNIADINKDGYLHYPEYMRAIGDKPEDDNKLINS